MHSEKLSDIKKELATLSSSEIISFCLKLAKYKKDNKEFLSYLIYDSSDSQAYITKVKDNLEKDFLNLNNHEYYSLKSLRKILRAINRYAKFTSSKEAETELLCWFCNNCLNHVNLNSSYKPLKNLYFRQLVKIKNLLGKLHEDLQFDYQQEFNLLIEKSRQLIKRFDKNEFGL
ncbi:hypothetical protein [Rubrolithibacter danxiaensis]|uniref:hypothetical protein n=1 Tax=Rubrolithibacter danxiaensis TaxID=3390805 RepID=UPI003BF8E36C